MIALIAPIADLSEATAIPERAQRELAEEDAEPGSLDLRFEAALGRLLAGNLLLAAVQRWVHRLWVEARSECGIAPGNRRQLHREHAQIYESLGSGDAGTARQLMAAHVDRTVEAAKTSDRDEERRR